MRRSLLLPFTVRWRRPARAREPLERGQKQGLTLSGRAAQARARLAPLWALSWPEAARKSWRRPGVWIVEEGRPNKVAAGWRLETATPTHPTLQPENEPQTRQDTAAEGAFGSMAPWSPAGRGRLSCDTEKSTARIHARTNACTARHRHLSSTCSALFAPMLKHE